MDAQFASLFFEDSANFKSAVQEGAGSEIIIENNKFQVGSFDHLRNLYRCGQYNVVKEAYKLSYRSVFPNSLWTPKSDIGDKYSPRLTIAALEKRVECEATHKFLVVIEKPWSVMNIKSCMKGKEKRDWFSFPIFGSKDEKLKLKKKKSYASGVSSTDFS